MYYFPYNNASHQNFPLLLNGSYVGGCLIVIKGAGAQGVRQIFIANSQNLNVYSRLYVAATSAWRPWKRFAPYDECAPKPAEADGEGKWSSINISKTDTSFSATTFVLPAGGTWAYAVMRVIEGSANIGGVGGLYTGVAAGGAVVTPQIDANYTTNGWRGFCWRIA